MPAYGSVAPAWLTLAGALFAVLLLALLARWTFGGTSISRLRHQPYQPDEPDYGLLVDVAVAPTRDDAELLRSVLADHGIRCTLAPAPQQGRRQTTPRQPPARAPYVVLVFPTDAERARSLVGIR